MRLGYTIVIRDTVVTFKIVVEIIIGRGIHRNVLHFEIGVV